MKKKSVTEHPDILNATAARMAKLFGEVAPHADAIIAARAAHADLETKLNKMRRAPSRVILGTNTVDAVNRRAAEMAVAAQPAGPPQQPGAPPFAPTAAAPPPPGVRPFAPGLERILGGNDLLDVRYLDAGRRAARAVGRIVIRRPTGGLVGYGTGSLISPTLLMTNNHVLPSKELAAGSFVEFNFQIDVNGNAMQRATFALRPDLFYTTSPEEQLDMTIVAVEERGRDGEALASFGFNPIAANPGGLIAGESVTIIQHPGGDMKQIALRENRIMKIAQGAERYLYYQTDTAPGSSGAPVFNDLWMVVALHHSGYPQRDAQGRILTPDGQLWTEDMGDQKIDWLANEGIRGVAIRDYLAALSGLTTVEGPLRDAALDPPARPELDEIEDRQLPPPAPNPIRTLASPSPSLTTATWTIPITISIDIGGALSALPGPRTQSTSAASPSIARTSGGVEGIFGRTAPAENWSGFSAQSLAAPGFDWHTALSLALACKLAYADGAGIAAVARNQWGMQTCEFIANGDSQCFVASTPDAILVAFRGTESVGDWLINLDLITTKRRYGTVHGGFCYAFQSVSERIEAELARFPGRPVVVTGHSLGGAMAANAAAAWRGRFPVLWLHTCGQPRTGMEDFARFMKDEYGDHYVRFVNDDDIVPRVPPGFSHAGRLIHFGPSGGLIERMRADGGVGEEILEAGLDAATEKPALTNTEFQALKMSLRVASHASTREAAMVGLEGFFPSISDHFMNNYIDKIRAKAR